MLTNSPRDRSQEDQRGNKKFSNGNTKANAFSAPEHIRSRPARVGHFCSEKREVPDAIVEPQRQVKAETASLLTASESLRFRRVEDNVNECCALERSLRSKR